MAKVKLDYKLRQCDHCGAKNIKRSFCIYDKDNILHIGRICLENEIFIDTSGNPNKAVKRVQKYLDNLKPYELEAIWEMSDG